MKIFYYFLSTSIGTFIFFILYEIFYILLFSIPHHSTIVYIISYLISIFFQHLLNELIVFQKGEILKSLWKSYIMYLLLMLPYLFFNEILVEYFKIHSRISMIIGLLFTGISGYFLSKYFIFSNQYIFIQLPLQEIHIE